MNKFSSKVKLADKYKVVFQMKTPLMGVGEMEGIGCTYGELDFVMIRQNGIFESILSEEEIKKASEIGFKLAEDVSKRNETISQIKREIYKTRKLFKILDQLEFSSLDEKEFKKYNDAYGRAISRLYRFFSRTEYYYFYKIEDTIRVFIRNKVKDERQVHSLFSVLLTSPKTHNILTQEELARIELAIAIKRNKQMRDQLIIKHLKKYDFIPYSQGRVFWTKETFNEELKILLNESEEKLIQLELKILTEDEKTKQRQQEAIELLNPPEEILNLIDAVKQWQEIKWQMRIIFNRTQSTDDCLGNRFYECMAKKSYLSLNQLSSMFERETQAVIKGKQVDVNEINARLKPIIGFLTDRKLTLFTGEEALELIEEVRKRTAGYNQQVKIITGNVANPGHVKGIARVFNDYGGVGDFYERIEKMEKGEILVAGTTGPEYMSAIKKAAAIVTDEGGVNSHAAIVARAFNIPCIVGTEFALKMIKDGNLVEVDANKGVVKILEQ